MLKNLLLILVLLPVLCFSQYEWTDKGDYKYTKFDNEIRQIFYSISGDSILVSGNNKLGIFDKDGELITDTTFTNDDYYSNSISSDRKSYTIINYTENQYKIYFNYKIYLLKNNNLLIKDSLVYHKRQLPYSSSMEIEIIEYSSLFGTVYTPNFTSYSLNHGGYSYTKKRNSYKISSNMSYYLNDYMLETYQTIQYGNITENTNVMTLYDVKNENAINKYKRFIKRINYNIDTTKDGTEYTNVAFSKNEKLVACVKNEFIDILTLPDFKLIKSIQLPYKINSFEFSHDNNRLYLVFDKELFSLDIEDERFDRLYSINEINDCKMTTHPNDINRIALISDDKIFLINKDFENFVKADFKLEKDTFQITDTISFENISEGINLKYKWDFGDDNYSEQMDPEHIYKDTGTYSIKLIAFNDFKSDTILLKNKIKIIEQQLFADFDIDYDESKFPIKCYLTDRSIGDNYSISWYVNMEKIGSKDTTSFLVDCPGKYHVQLDISKGIFHDTKYDTIVIEAYYSKNDNLINERIINTNHKLETYNILEYDDNYYFNVVFDSIDIGYVSEIYKMDKDFDYNRQMRFDGYFYPPYEPTIYKDKLIFKYDSSLKMNDLSYLVTDFNGKIKYNFSENFMQNAAKIFSENQINTTQIKVYNDSLYVLTTYGIDKYYTYTTLFLINSTNYEPVQLEFFEEHRVYDADFFKNKNNIIAYSFLSKRYIHTPPYESVIPVLIYNNKEFNWDTDYGKEPRLMDNYFSDSFIVSLYQSINNRKNKLVHYNISNKIVEFEYDVSENSKLNKIIRKNDSLYIAGSNNNKAAFYIYNLKTYQIDSVVFEKRIGEFTDLRFNENGNLVLFGKLYNNLNDKIYIAEYDFDLTDNGGGTIEPKDSTELDVFHNLMIYPNPVTEDLLIQFESESAQNVVLKIYDIDGTFIQEVVSDVIEGDNQIHVKLKNIAKGVYILNVKTDKGIVSRKFVKE